jgi:hypothetical protein
VMHQRVATRFSWSGPLADSALRRVTAPKCLAFWVCRSGKKEDVDPHQL